MPKFQKAHRKGPSENPSSANLCELHESCGLTKIGSHHKKTCEGSKIYQSCYFLEHLWKIWTNSLQIICLLLLFPQHLVDEVIEKAGLCSYNLVCFSLKLQAKLTVAETMHEKFLLLSDLKLLGTVCISVYFRHFVWWFTSELNSRIQKCYEVEIYIVDNPCAVNYFQRKAPL